MESSEGRAANHRRRWGLFSTGLVSCDLVPLVSCDLGPRGSKGEGGQGRGTGGGGGGCKRAWGVEDWDVMRAGTGGAGETEDGKTTKGRQGAMSLG